jgi:hypothetical protein
MNELHRDALKDIARPEFEESVFRATVTTARRTRHKRVAVRMAGAACAVIAGATLLLQWSVPTQVALTPPGTGAAQSEKQISSGESQPSITRVRTQPLLPEQLIVTRESSFAVVRSATGGKVKIHILSDEQLLASFEGHPVALVPRGPHNAELIFPGQITQP